MFFVQHAVYGIVRNPCYSGIMLLCDGDLFIRHNAWLFILPVVFRASMTVLMKNTEEKWLANLYGIANYGMQEVTVNEQNPQAVGFYEHAGFSIHKRTNCDEEGNPYPLLYMKSAE